MKQTRLFFLCPMLVFIASGCVTNITSRTEPERVRQTTHQEIPIFSYERKAPDAEIKPAWSYGSATHEVFTLSYNSTTAGEWIRAEYWKQKSPGKKKLVIVLPIIDSVRFVGEHYTHVMTAWNGNDEFNVILVEDTKKILYLEELAHARTQKEFLDVLAVSTVSIAQYVVDIRRLIDWAETREEIDPQKIGIIGGSVSAYLASLVMAADARIRAGIFDKGGGSWHKLFAYSEEREALWSRTTVMKRFGWTRPEFEKTVQSVMEQVDPIRWANRIDPKRVLLISARDDTWVPGETTKLFWRALGKPEWFEYHTSHKMAFALSLTVLGGHYADFRIYNHFKRNL